jgi:hypothetical protein
MKGDQTMHLHVDAGTVPPTVVLRDPDDFTTLRAVLVVPSHLWLDPDTITELASPVDEAWRAQLAQMLAYAGSKGWRDEQGRVRAHVEVANG